jgi:cytidylate kinase
MFTGAESIAQEVAQDLGFRYVDEEIVARAAEMKNLTASEVASTERRQSFISQVIEDISDASSDLVAYIKNDKEARRPSDAVRDLIREAILDTAKEGNVVIVAHAASYALARGRQVLRVLITGSEFGRVNKWAQTSGGRSPRQAAEEIRESDAARADYLRRFYDVEQELAEHYDITLSVDSFQPAAIRSLIVSASKLVD